MYERDSKDLYCSTVENDPGETTRVWEEEYTNYVCEGISNMQRKLMRGGSNCRFFAHIINTVVSLYLRGSLMKS